MRYKHNAADTAALLILLVIGGAAAFEAALALQWISIGSVPGEGARYEGYVMSAALAAMLAAIVTSFVLAARDQISFPSAFFAVAAAALMVARFYTFDPYYLPTLIRYSDSGGFSPASVYSVAAAGLLASFLCLARPRIGFLLTVLVLLLCAFTALFVGFGH